MKNKILHYSLMELGMSSRYIEIFENSSLHLFDIVSFDNPPFNIWEVVSGRRSSKAVLEIKNIQIEFSKYKDKFKITDSLFFLELFGLKMRTIQKLRKKQNIYTVSQLINSSDDVIDVDVTEVISSYINWISTNREDIAKELDVSNTKILTREKNNISENKKYLKNLKYLGIESFPDTLKEFLDMDFRFKDLLIMRMKNRTLAEVGGKMNITRERVRQIEKKVKAILPEFKDVEKYRQFLMYYDTSTKNFTWLTGESEYIYRYIRFAYGAGKGNDIEEYILNSDNISEQKKEEFLRKNNYYLDVDGVPQKISDKNILKNVLYSNQQVMTLENLAEMVNKFVDAHNISKNHYVLPDRALEARLSRQKVITRTNGYFRYYEYSAEDILEYLDELNDLFKVPDGIYGIEYFFEADRVLMDTLDIQAPSELATIIKSLGTENFGRLNKIVRKTQVYIGNIKPENKNDFYISILRRFNGKSQDCVIDYLFTKYRLRKQTSMAFITSQFKKYIYGKKIIFDTVVPKDDIFYEILNKIINKPIYTMDLLSSLVKSVDKNVEITPQLIHQIGYRERGGTIIKNNFATQRDAIKALWLEKDYVLKSEIEEFHEKSFDFIAYDMELNHDLLRVTPQRYMTIKKFSDGGFTKADIINFIDKAFNFAPDNRFFTLYELKKNGFNHDFIDDTGFDDYFYERLIFTSPEIRTIRTKGFIFIKNSQGDKRTPALIDFFKQEITDESVDIDDFVSNIQNKFGIDLDKFKIMEKIQKSEFIYSSEMNKIYKNKKIMLNSIYKNIGVQDV